MFDEPFAGRSSFIHRLDPRFRLGTAILAAVSLAVLHTPGAAAWGLGLAFFLLLLSCPPPGPLVKRLLVVNVFILFLWLTVPFAMAGAGQEDALAVFGPFVLSRGGAGLALLATLKANAIVMLFLALVASLESPVIGSAMERLRVPGKLVFLFLFTYRYVHVIAAEWRRLQTAAALRGFRPRTDRHSYRTIGNMLGMVFVRGFERSGRVYEAMTLRGFSGRFQTVAAFHASVRDVVFAAMALLCLVSLLWYDLNPDAFRLEFSFG